MSKSTNYITDILKKERLTKKINQSELANELGIPQSHLSKIENGKGNPSLSLIIGLTRLLGLELIIIPKKHEQMISSLIRGTTIDQTPLYQLNEDSDDE